MKTKHILFTVTLALLSSHCASSCSDDKDKGNASAEPLKAAPGARGTLRDTHVRMPFRDAGATEVLSNEHDL